MSEIPTKPKQRRGFAAMPADRVKEIARLGGAATKPEDRTFSRNRALAAKAGAAGGRISKRPKMTPT